LVAAHFPLLSWLIASSRIVLMWLSDGSQFAVFC